MEALQQSQPHDGVELLVKMAQNGQIDPWNLDIAQVADQYLQAVAELKESDLRRTGKTLLYLAILLRMKSDQLAGINYLYGPDEDIIEDWQPDDPLETTALHLVSIPTRFTSLDEVIKRRTSTKQPRIRPVTLKDLLLELRKYEELEKKRSLREKVEKADQRRMVDYSHLTSDDIEELAHEEFLEDTIFRLQNILKRIFIDHESVSLTELQEEGGMDKISAFIALLFMESRGEAEMFQEAFYEELFVRRASTEQPGGPTETVTAEESSDSENGTIKLVSPSHDGPLALDVPKQEIA